MLRIALEGRSLAAHFDLVATQAPENRRDRGIDHRELIAQEKWLDLEQVSALQDGLAQRFLEFELLLLVGLALDLLGQLVPVALDSIQGEPELGAIDRIDRHQRRMRKALVQVIDDDARVIE